MEWFIIIFILLILLFIGLIFIYDSISEKETKSIKEQLSKKQDNIKKFDANTNTIKKLTKEEKEELIQNTREFVKFHSEKTAQILKNWLKEEDNK